MSDKISEILLAHSSVSLGASSRNTRADGTVDSHSPIKKLNTPESFSDAMLILFRADNLWLMVSSDALRAMNSSGGGSKARVCS
jgi:hypothetical protein